MLNLTQLTFELERLSSGGTEVQGAKLRVFWHGKLDPAASRVKILTKSNNVGIYTLQDR